MGKDINRIKVILVEKKRTNKWLAEQLGKDPATVSKWCTNTIQPSLDTLLKIAELLNVQIQELVKWVSRNLVEINFRHPNVMPNFAVWKTITYRHWHKWCCQPRF